MSMSFRLVAPLILSVFVGGASSLPRADIDQWYGLQLGSIPSEPPAPVSQPWDIVSVAADGNGRICGLTFVDVGVEGMSDAPPGYIPKRVKSKEMLAADARAVLDYVVSRLGPANEDSLTSGERVLEWQRNDKRAVLRSASLYLSSDGVYLQINPLEVLEDKMNIPTNPPASDFAEGDCRNSSPAS